MMNSPRLQPGDQKAIRPSSSPSSTLWALDGEEEEIFRFLSPGLKAGAIHHYTRSNRMAGKEGTRQWIETGYPGVVFEDTQVGRLKKQIFDASDKEIESILKEYGVPADSEL